jgi:hypothetical protein
VFDILRCDKLGSRVETMISWAVELRPHDGNTCRRAFLPASEYHVGMWDGLCTCF